MSVESVEGAALRLVVDVAVLGRDPKPGESISVSGVCLTVVENDGGRVAFDVIGQTVRLSTLADVREGDLVNLEGALRVGDEIGGHQVQGHVDGVGRVRSVDARGDETWMTIDAPTAVMETLVPQGWVSVDGISLTVASIDGADAFSVALIPTTLAITSLGDATAGTRVNLEGDPLGKHVRQWMKARHVPAHIR
jgi:riboflavin synthase alpha subunit